MHDAQDTDPSRHFYKAPTPPKRSNIFSGGAGFLVARPSIGGLVVSAKPSAIDLAHLGLPRTHDTQRPAAPATDDDLATRMLRLGATWWPDWDTYARHLSRIQVDDVIYDFHFPPQTHVGYPSTGGVWVVKLSRDELWFDGFGRRDERTRTWPRKPKEWDLRMGMALDMDEKCSVIKLFGGTFYEDLEGCAGEVARSLKEGREMFGQYEELLRTMDDGEYVKKWLAGSQKREHHSDSEDEYFWDDGAGNNRNGHGKGCLVS
ncbi:uncharacterized protein CTRU02_204774 [Colletotrichum truncatum]|uniref:Uncharacterized protein n=1 Tax=Colletotrichum truncatum TaxID=5467 RepID=A0ACC3ZD25_COLTU|nr:uncharacterized protein CTRU02_03010 [Colletotrichum truncatum]KAF6797968.1 hypothetical protein CTRU02_03010 [Colletotrichum truncatum]